MQAQTALECDPRSVRTARRFVTETMCAGQVPPTMVDTAALLVSELVSNAVLHARSGVELSIACRPDWARVDVADGSPRGLTRRHHQLDATTGRGLMLVDRLASTWGVEPFAAGKRVWFELRPQPEVSDALSEPDLDAYLELDASSRLAGTVSERPHADAGLVRVRLVQFPLEIYRRASEHYEELMREFALIALHSQAEAAGHSVPGRLITLIDQLNLQYAAAVSEADVRRSAALDRGDAEIDLGYDVPPAAGPASAHLGEMLAEADEYCRRGEHLLTLATPPDAVAFRTWYLQEFVNQIAGAAPTPWPDFAQQHGVEPVG